MTTPESAAGKATAMGEAVARLYELLNLARNNARAETDIADLMLETFAAEQKFYAYLDANTDELADHPLWQGYFNKYVLRVSHPMTVIACYTMGDAFALASDRIAAQHKTVPADHPVLLEIRRLGTDTPLFRMLDNAHSTADKVGHVAEEFFAATALAMARREIKREPAEQPGIARVREIVRLSPPDDLIARWAVTEAARINTTANPWDTSVENAGLDLESVVLIADDPALVDIDKKPRNPVARERFHAVEQLVVHYLVHRAEAERTTTSSDRDVSAHIDQVPKIQRLIDDANPQTTAFNAEPTPTDDRSAPVADPDITTQPEVEP